MARSSSSAKVRAASAAPTRATWRGAPTGAPGAGQRDHEELECGADQDGGEQVSHLIAPRVLTADDTSDWFRLRFEYNAASAVQLRLYVNDELAAAQSTLRAAELARSPRDDAGTGDDPLAAVDVDKPQDYDLVTAILERRA